MSKTPRTDAKEWTVLSSYEPTVNVVLSSFARQLEAENAELREALESAIDIIGHPDDSFTQYARALLAKVEGK